MKESNTKVVGVKFNLNDATERIIFETMNKSCNRSKLIKNALISFLGLNIQEVYKEELK